MGYTIFMSTKKILSIGALLIALVGLVWFSRSDTPNKTSADTFYKSIPYRLSFSYPSDYFLEEKNTGSATRSRYTITLYEDTKENRLVREGKSPGREGPVAITVDIFQNLENQSLESWVRGTSDIVMMSVTFLSSSDEIVNIFESILEALSLD